MADEPKKEFRAVARGVRMSARKARLVMDVVRGRNAQDAVTLLRFVNKRAAPAVSKLIASAVANAEEYANQKGVDVNTASLVVFDARADIGPQMKRWRPRSRGMANPFTRHTCHLTVTLAEAATVEERKQGRPAFARPRKRMSKEQRLARRDGAVASDAAEAAVAADKPASAEGKAETAKAAPAAKKAPAKGASGGSKDKKPAKSGGKAAGGSKAGKGSAEKKPAKKSAKK